MVTRRLVQSGSPYEPRIGFSRAVRVGDRVLVAGTAPVQPDGGCDPDPGAQAERCWAIVAEALAAAGASMEQVVRTRMYLTDAGDAEAVGAAHAAVFGNVRPAATMVVVAGLIDPRWRVEVEAEAVIDSGGVSRQQLTEAFKGVPTVDLQRLRADLDEGADPTFA